MIRVHVARDPESVGRLAAAEFLHAVAGRRDSVLGLATGSSVEPVYAALRAAPAETFAAARAFALDEYLGLPVADPRSYASVIRTQVVEPLGFDAASVAVPPGDIEPGDASAGADYERRIAQAGGIDVQLLGIGRNGHLGFNEPGSSWDSRTRVVRLADETRRDNARFFARSEDVPRYAVTQGLATIAEARRLVVVARGSAKAAAVAAALIGPVAESVPASMLQRHPHVTVVLDEAAASGLPVDTLDARTGVVRWP